MKKILGKDFHFPGKKKNVVKKKMTHAYAKMLACYAKL